jgi:hypothetical protein
VGHCTKEEVRKAVVALVAVTRDKIYDEYRDLPGNTGHVAGYLRAAKLLEEELYLLDPLANNEHLWYHEHKPRKQREADMEQREKDTAIKAAHTKKELASIQATVLRRVRERILDEYTAFSGDPKNAKTNVRGYLRAMAIVDEELETLEPHKKGSPWDKVAKASDDKETPEPEPPKPPSPTNQKLTEKQAQYVLDHPETPLADLADILEVETVTISSIRRRRSWKHLEPSGGAHGSN